MNNSDSEIPAYVFAKWYGIVWNTNVIGNVMTQQQLVRLRLLNGSAVTVFSVCAAESTTLSLMRRHCVLLFFHVGHAGNKLTVALAASRMAQPSKPSGCDTQRSPSRPFAVLHSLRLCRNISPMSTDCWTSSQFGLHMFFFFYGIQMMSTACNSSRARTVFLLHREASHFLWGWMTLGLIHNAFYPIWIHK